MSIENPDSSSAPARSLSAGRGLEWITESWALFMKMPGLWIVLTLIVFGISMVCGVVPFLGSLLSPFVTTLLMSGMMLAARKLQTTGSMEVADLFEILSHPALKPLLILTLIYVAMLAAAAVVVFGVFGIGGGALALLGGAINGENTALAAGIGSMLLALLIFLAVLAPILAMYWYAVPLVLFRNLEPWNAMKASLAAVLVNMMPLLVYGVVATLLVFVAMIPLMLGLLIAMPVLGISWLISYQDLFEGA
ncbi:MAG: hypothetical protein KA739_02715 [Pseudomonadales bacterium]|jgi:uncharacterized membrane protein|nr:hypothetical protein [Gammaproteobacteria bacterium]MBP6050735.1 hypothetical protein [Pseudomonadales bacterium]MBK6584475.1 hypothetical protein [Gammaproteobacteria bacterium]MBK7520933.1 hypothetical protein [Gammaproteobacteria bacterium]MBK8309110.1 hypothetical protein [Gammaproteobacteria bacterium]